MATKKKPFLSYFILTFLVFFVVYLFAYFLILLINNSFDKTVQIAFSKRNLFKTCFVTLVYALIMAFLIKRKEKQLKK